MKDSTTPAELPERPTIQQSAAYLNVNPVFVRRRIAEGKIRAWFYGARTIRVDRESLLQFARGAI